MAWVHGVAAWDAVGHDGTMHTTSLTGVESIFYEGLPASCLTPSFPRGHAPGLRCEVSGRACPRVVFTTRVRASADYLVFFYVAKVVHCIELNHPIPTD